MRRLIIITLLCATPSAAFGQTASANTITGMGYSYPPITVAPGQLISVFMAGNVEGSIGATVQNITAQVRRRRAYLSHKIALDARPFARPAPAAAGFSAWAPGLIPQYRFVGGAQVKTGACRRGSEPRRSISAAGNGSRFRALP